MQKEDRIVHHRVEIVEACDSKLVLKIDGINISFSWSQLTPCLANADKNDREKIEISPSGYGLHWPTLDEDLSIDGLLDIKHERHYRQDFA